MAGLTNTLYPPIVATSMPAFPNESSCKIYFSLSDYNTASEIRNVQVIISNQNNNLSALDSGLYPSEIKIATLNLDETVTTKANYYVEIAPSDLTTKKFETNQYYKVQLRFTSINAEAPPSSGKGLAFWLDKNKALFSEWSTVCLVKGIDTPKLYIKGFEEEDSNLNNTITTTEVMSLVGGMYFANNDSTEKEYLKYYQVKLYNDSTNELVFDSDKIYTNEYNPNEINYILPYELNVGVRYRLEIPFTTNNGYTDSFKRTLSVISDSIEDLNATISAETDIENGRVAIKVKSNNITDTFLGNLVIRRTSSESNFKIWKDIKFTLINDNSNLNFTYYDYTVESGVWYLYAVQRINSKGTRSSVIEIKKPLMMEFDSIFLTTAEMQLNVKFDAIISSFKTTLSESKIETIGSKYPFFRRNGNISYRQFPISGLITSFCNRSEVYNPDNGKDRDSLTGVTEDYSLSEYQEDLFLNKKTIYGDNKTYYDEYNSENDINDYQDYIYEREYREKIMDFLHSNDVKLFRSNTEGNILIKLMDINFTPNSSLGRMLYSFSGTAYEIDECSLDNFDKYDIINIGEWTQYIKNDTEKLGQISTTVNANEEVMQIIQNKYNSSTTEKRASTVKYLGRLKIEFESDPYLIRVNSENFELPLEPLLNKSDATDENTLYGYIVAINGTPMVVSKRGVFELKDGNIDITSVQFPVQSEVSINYVVTLTEEEDAKKLASNLYYYTKVGQIFDTFAVDSSVFLQIYTKYLENYSSYYQRLIALDKISIEAVPNTVVYISDSFDSNNYYRHLVGPTGILTLYDPETTFSNFYFHGVHLYSSEDETGNEVRDNQYKETGLTVDDYKTIIHPVKNGVYSITNSDKQYIYYRNGWYEFTSDKDVLCPVTALIDYIYELAKGEY